MQLGVRAVQVAILIHMAYSRRVLCCLSLHYITAFRRFTQVISLKAGLHAEYVVRQGHKQVLRQGHSRVPGQVPQQAHPRSSHPAPTQQQPALTPPSRVESRPHHHTAPMPPSRLSHTVPTPPQRCCNAAPTPSSHRHNAAATQSQRHLHAAACSSHTVFTPRCTQLSRRSHAG